MAQNTPPERVEQRASQDRCTGATAKSKSEGSWTTVAGGQKPSLAWHKRKCERSHAFAGAVGTGPVAEEPLREQAVYNQS
jgi:hypothetical protein